MLILVKKRTVAFNKWENCQGGSRGALASFPGRVDSKNNTVDRQLGLVLIVSGRVSGRG